MNQQIESGGVFLKLMIAGSALAGKQPPYPLGIPSNEKEVDISCGEDGHELFADDARCARNGHPHMFSLRHGSIIDASMEPRLLRVFK